MNKQSVIIIICIYLCYTGYDYNIVGVNNLNKPLIYITRKIPKSIVKPYEKFLEFRMWEEEEIPVPRDILLEEIQKADGLLSVLSDSIDKEVFETGPKLKIVSNFAVGYDNIDVAEAGKHNIIVTNTPDVLTESTADLGFSLLMAAARRLVESSEYIKADKWKSWAPFMFAGSDIYNKTIGIVGMGRIGKAIARRAKGFNMTILYHNRSRDKATEDELQAEYVTFEKLLKEADFVVSVVPLTEETRNIFDEKAFNIMKQSAIFINISRGQTVDEEALYEALKKKKITAAGLDVFENEPIRADHPLLSLDNVVCTPHIGSASVQTRTAMLELCLDNLKAVLNGDGPITPVK